MKGFGEPPTKLEFYGFGDMTMDEESPTNCLRRKSMKTEKGKRAWSMGSQNLSQGRKPNRQRLMNADGNGRKVSNPGSPLVAPYRPDATAPA